MERLCKQPRCELFSKAKEGRGPVATLSRESSIKMQPPERRLDFKLLISEPSPSRPPIPSQIMRRELDRWSFWGRDAQTSTKVLNHRLFYVLPFPVPVIVTAITNYVCTVAQYLIWETTDIYSVVIITCRESTSRFIGCPSTKAFYVFQVKNWVIHC